MKRMIPRSYITSSASSCTWTCSLAPSNTTPAPSPPPPVPAPPQTCDDPNAWRHDNACGYRGYYMIEGAWVGDDYFYCSCGEEIYPPYTASEGAHTTTWCCGDDSPAVPPPTTFTLSGCATPYPTTATGTWSGIGSCAMSGSFTLNWNGTAYVGTHHAGLGDIGVTITPISFSTWSFTFTSSVYTIQDKNGGSFCGFLPGVNSIVFVAPCSDNTVSLFLTA
jgi:hypothetical protein